MSRSTQSRSSRRLLTVLALAIPAILAGLAWQAVSAAGQRLETARQDLESSREMVADITRLRRQPRIAALSEESPGEITERVSQAMQQASLPATALLQVQPQPAVRFNRSQYLLRSTQVELREVTLQQIVRFCVSLADASQGMVIRDLNLTEPRSAGVAEERWNAEITLTQTIFSPTIR